MPTPTAFLTHVIKTAALHGIELILSPAEDVYTQDEGSACGGFFDDLRHVLSVGCGRGDWMTTLAHEFGHLEQYLEGKFGPSEFGPIDPYAMLERWFAGEDFPADEIDRAVATCVECELDAERRALGHISRYNLSQDFASYIAAANGYAMTYLHARRTRKWPKEKTWTDTKLVPNDRILAQSELRLTPAVQRYIRSRG